MEITKEKKLELSKEFPVSKGRLYDAWTKPEDLSSWWKPQGSKLEEVENDVKVNSNFRYVFGRTEDANSFIVSGKYLEVKEHERLVYTWDWESSEKTLGGGNFKLTVRFHNTENGCRVVISQEDLKEQETLAPHRQGWEKALDDLYNYLVNKSKKNVSGYNETEEQQKVGEG